jgi:phosphomethylpyrimidine synthase
MRTYPHAPGHRTKGISVNINEDVRKYAAEQAISEEEALAKGMAESKEFIQDGAEVCTKA